MITTISFLINFLYLLEAAVVVEKSYDYVIVGAGSAGATLANRLSEDTDINVLLLEAGEKPPKQTEIPLVSSFEFNSLIEWNYTIEPNGRSCLGAIDQTCLFARGKTLGGSSQINHMLYVRGNQRDYDLWQENGADGWSYKDVFQYFTKSEDVQIRSEIIDEEYHGTDGPLTVSLANYESDLKTVYLKAFSEIGFDNVDFNGPTQQGYGVSQYTERNGFRCSSEKAYLQPAYSRNNLDIITGALVSKVNINEMKAAEGVFYIKNNMMYYVEANIEVILSAGAINTPQILMLSGIGPQKELEKLNIVPVADLPVGKNLQDHVITYGLLYTVKADNVSTTKEINKAKQSVDRGFHYPEVLNGILSISSIREVLGYVKSKFEKESGDYNDIQIFMASGLTVPPFMNEEINDYLKQFDNKQCISILVSNLHPQSVGDVTLRSNDPFEKPKININFFSSPQDLKVLVYGLKLAKKLVKTNAFSKVQPKLIGPLPGCENIPISSEKYLECISRLMTASLYHPVGTCKMGMENDSTTVVDSKLKIKGISRLRIVDASVLPRITSGNTNAPVIMVAEKAADLIKDFRKQML